MKINYLTFKIKDEDGLTIREFLNNYYVPRKNANNLEMFNLIRVNDNVVNVHYRLKENDELSFKLAPLDGLIKPFEGAVDIIYEDEHIVIVNKPVKLLVRPNSKTLDTLTNRLANYFHNKGYDYPVLPINRLDYNCSGIIVFAKNFISLSYLFKQDELNLIKKTYIAICEKPFKNPEGRITYKLGKDQKTNKIIVTDSGRESTTNYFVLEQDNQYSKVELKVRNERAHQLRAHLAHIGHPVAGDKLYGSKENKQMRLHLFKIQFNHPLANKVIEFKIKEPF